MGTPWRGLLALQNKPTADGRRFKTLTWRTLPLGLKWQRVDAMGHDDSVTVGSLETAGLGTVEQAVENGWVSAELAAESALDPKAVGLWGSGELFDDADPDTMPRLAEDVAEVMLMLEKRVTAPSIDAIAVGQVMLVEPGQDEPPSEERLDEMFDEWMDTGVEPVFEVLFEEGLVAAATLVTTPAFSEVRPFELLAAEPGEGGDDEEAPASDASTQRAMALTAAAPSLPPVDLFADPGFTAPTPIRITERADGLLQVAGHVGAWQTCHLGVRDACVAPPPTQAAYVPFHRHVLELADGTLLGVGRITTGFGKVGTGCDHDDCRRGKSDHACEALSLAQAIAHHDQQTPLAWVRAGEDEHGIYVVGVVDADLSAEGRALLEREKFSGDWREHGPGLELVELLALATGAPAFPIPRSYMRNGRQVSLTAAFVPPLDKPSAGGDYRRQLARSVADMVVADLRAAGLVTHAQPDLDGIEQAALTAAATEHTGAMIALVPSAADADRLAVEGGEPAADLHMTLAYLGEADAIDEDTRMAILDRMATLAQTWTETDGVTAPLDADGFSVSVFNPDSDDRETCIVVGVSGTDVDTIHEHVELALGEVFTPPDQHAPFVAHVTLAYTDDLSMVEEIAETRTGPIVFDRLRVAFAGVATDIPLGPPVEPDAAAQAAALAAEVDAALDAVGAHERAREAAALLKELEAAGV